jgi:acyl carrier protein
MNDLTRRVHTLIQAELGTPAERITPHTRIAELGDSLAWLGLLSAIEAEFGFEVDESQEGRLVTVADLVRLLERRAVVSPT